MEEILALIEDVSPDEYAYLESKKLDIAPYDKENRRMVLRRSDVTGGSVFYHVPPNRVEDTIKILIGELTEKVRDELGNYRNQK